MINKLKTLPLPIIKIKKVKKTPVKTKLFSGLTLYNKFFIRLNNDYYIPLYTLPYYTNFFKNDWSEWYMVKKYILQKYKSYIKTNFNEQIEKILFPNQPYTTDDVMILTKLALGIGDEDKLLSQLSMLGFDKHIKKNYTNYNWVINSYLDSSVPVEVGIGKFKQKTINQLILHTSDKLSLSIFDTSNILFSNKYALHLHSSDLLLKYYVALINERMEVFTPSGKYWVFKRKPVCTYPIIDYSEVDWDKLIENHKQYGDTEITNRLEIATTSYSIVDDSVYILTYMAKKKLYPKISVASVDVSVCKSDKWRNHVDPFIIRIPREMIEEKELKYKFNNVYMKEIKMTLKHGLLGDVVFDIGGVENLEDYFINKKLFN